MRLLAKRVLLVLTLLGLVRLPVLAAPSAAPPAPDPVWTLPSPSRSVFALAYSPDGKTLAVGENAAGRVIDIGTGRVVAPPEAFGRVLLLDAGSGVVRRTLLVSSPGQTRKKPSPQTAAYGNIWSLAFSPDGRALAVGAASQTVGEITLWDPSTGQRKQTLLSGGYDLNNHTLCFSPDGRQLAVSVTDRALDSASHWEVGVGRIWIWNVPAYRLKRRLVIRRSGAIAYAPDNHTLLAGGSDLDLWDTRTGRKIRTLTPNIPAGSGLGTYPDASDVVFSPDGRLVAGGSPFTDSVARLWDARTGRLLKNMSRSGEDGPANVRGDVAFASDGSLLIGSTGSSGKPHDVRFWDAHSGTLVRTLNIDAEYFALSPDGTRLASVEGYYTVHLWRIH